VRIRSLGRVAYEPTWRAMQEFTRARAADAEDELWLLEHPPVYTLGLAGRHQHVLAPGDIPVVSTDRGGQVTYHGPGQAIAYVLLDLRPASPRYCTWIAEELSAQNHHALFIPEGVAHGFQTLTDDVEVFYQISEAYHAELSRGVRWDDPAFNIAWPEDDRTLSDRDRQYPDYLR